MINNKYNEKVIQQKRKQIRNELISESKNIKGDNISEISNSDLKILFEKYDKIFLNNWFRDCFRGSLKFSLSKRMTKSAGLTICPKTIGAMPAEKIIIEIRIGVDFIFNYDLLNEDKVVSGIKTRSSFEALQIVFEHELCHAIEFIHFHRSSCKGERFKTLAQNLFGHTSSYHQLPTHRELARKNLGLNLGDKVSFTYEDKKLTGNIYAINKRATVMVKNNKGQYVDSKGNRYTKYYVPLEALKK